MPTDLPNINAAINEATNGNTIVIMPGEYNETLTLTKSITLQGSGRYNTFIGGMEKDCGIHCMAPEITIEKLYIGNADTLIFLDESHRSIVRNCYIGNCRGESGNPGDTVTGIKVNNSKTMHN